MWAMGKYTRNIQNPIKINTVEYFIRSAIAPIMSAGVMIRKHQLIHGVDVCDTQYE